jgi:hypothetical protein
LIALGVVALPFLDFSFEELSTLTYCPVFFVLLEKSKNMYTWEQEKQKQRTNLGPSKLDLHMELLDACLAGNVNKVNIVKKVDNVKMSNKVNKVNKVTNINKVNN